MDIFKTLRFFLNCVNIFWISWTILSNYLLNARTFLRVLNNIRNLEIFLNCRNIFLNFTVFFNSRTTFKILVTTFWPFLRLVNIFKTLRFFLNCVNIFWFSRTILSNCLLNMFKSCKHFQNEKHNKRWRTCKKNGQLNSDRTAEKKRMLAIEWLKQ
jgi:hypothetical protein